MVRADLLDDDRREALGRLVEQQQPRAGAQDAADRQHLLLAAGELGALAARAAPRDWETARKCVSRAKPARLDLRRQHQVLLDVEAREDAALLRADRDAGAGDLVRGEPRSARGPRSAPSRCGSPTMPMIDFKRRGLAGAVAPEQRDDLAAIARRRSRRAGCGIRRTRPAGPRPRAAARAARHVMAHSRYRPRAPAGSSETVA